MFASHRSGRRLATLSLTAALVAATFASPVGNPLAAQDEAPQYGPARGTLVIAGGGNLNDTGIFERFIAAAGGKDAYIVIVPTAGGNFARDSTPREYEAERVLASWKKLGLTNVHMLHTHDPAVANTEAFAGQLSKASGVWFNGGRQWNIVDSYAGTKTYDAFHAVLDRGGVIGGSSAGATIQGEYLVRGAVSGSNVVMAPEPEHQEAFRFLRRSAIDQHIDTRDRWKDIAPVIAKFPTLIGIGLSEGTAVVVEGDAFEVIGRGKVAIHDNTNTMPAGPDGYFTLEAGDRYNLAARRELTTAAP